MLIHQAEIWGHGMGDVRLAGGQITAIGALSPQPGEAILDAAGGALLPGLHDHHIHLTALAARKTSVICGPPEVTDAATLAARLQAAPGTGWIRGIMYHESLMGLPNAAALDALVADRPLRMQHRGGRLWLFNSAALALLLAAAPPPPTLDLTTGHLFDADDWLRGALASQPPQLGATSAQLATFGITGLTEMSPRNDAAMAAHFAAEQTRGALLQRLYVAGTLGLANAPPGPWQLGPAKLHLHEAALPDLDETIAFIRDAHAQRRPVASHCTTEVELVFTLAALAAAGPAAGLQDRIEHAGICPDHLLAEIAAMGLAVISQPHFIAERGDQYLTDVPTADHGALYRLAAFAKAGIPLAAGSDAPFGSADPWAAMAAAVSRQTGQGKILGAQEALTPEDALALFLADPQDLSRQRPLTPGAPADLCLLTLPWAKARRPLSAQNVAATFIKGGLVYQAVHQPPIMRQGS